ncbi:MAG: IS91 family transposase [Burkholderiales bacterium]|nr:IS91 family transposase [Burkholderiales bacterium]
MAARDTGARRGKLELADIVRRHGEAFRAAHGLCSVQHRALRAIERCRTAALRGELRACDACGHRRYVYHSCRNRHCPKCQARARERWLEAQRAELLPVPYYHLVFTLPHELNALAQGNPRSIYAMLFAAASATLVEFGRNPRWLGGEIAATLVLHTWGQTLTQHLHVHALVAAGALLASGGWVRSQRGFLFPVRALSKVFRGKFLEAFGDALDGGDLVLAAGTAAFAGGRARSDLFRALRRHDWVVYAKQPFAGPEAVLAYLGRYTHRTAIGNERLVSLSADAVCFRYRDYAHGAKQRVMSLATSEFLRRFCLHVLPRGFNRIRHYGLLANRNKRELLQRARAALDVTLVPATPVAAEPVAAFWQRVAAIDIEACPHCATGRLHVVATIAPQPHPPP